MRRKFDHMFEYPGTSFRKLFILRFLLTIREISNSLAVVSQPEHSRNIVF